MPKYGYLYKLQKELPSLFTDEILTFEEEGSIYHKQIPCLQSQLICIYSKKKCYLEDSESEELIIPYHYKISKIKSEPDYFQTNTV